MAAAEYYSGACMDMVPKHLLAPHMLWRAQTEQIGGREDEENITQGRIMWLPAFEDLPERAVRRAHGKGAVEEGIYNHPVVIVSRPLDDENYVHFHLITSLQGKKLDQLYPKSNEFHTSRRSWYLPISPSPDHPDASSKKAKKRFPTLTLANGATLRWDSYVNIRHVYKIKWSLLKPYSNLNTPRTTLFRLERESTVRMIAKGKVLTLYEPSEQMPALGVQTRRTAPPCLSTSTELASRNEQSVYCPNSPDPEDESIASLSTPPTLSVQKPDGWVLSSGGDRTTELPSKDRLDAKARPSFLRRIFDKLFPYRQRR